MLRISRLTDYGILLLVEVARRPKDRHNATELSEEAGVPLPTVAKLLKMLAKGGLLEGHRGIQGGYSLARPPEAITMAEVVQAVEGPIALTLCSEGPGACDMEHGCATGDHMRLVNHALVEALERVTLAQLLQPAPPKFITITRKTK